MPPKKKASVAKKRVAEAEPILIKYNSVPATGQNAAVEPAPRSSRRKRGLSPESDEPVKPVKKSKLSSKRTNKADEEKEVDEQTTEDKTEEVAKETDSPKVPEPEYKGTFDIFETGFGGGSMYSTYLPLNTKGWNATTEPESLYNEIKRRQALDECTARIELCQGGAYRGRPVNEEAEPPVFGCPGNFVVRRVNQIALWKIQGKEMDLYGDTFDIEESGDTRPGPAVEVSIRVGRDECGVESTSGGTFKMRRLWAQNKGGALEEVFEGYANVGITFNVLMKHRFYAGERKTHNGPDKEYKFTFWAVRSRKLADGTVIGVKDLKIGDGDESE
ncbi:hypothetical protein PENSPDRAFT_757424 [Peniophora sp. CONT]|nr:hypothetical protein PENSPDRAFT_757424 [Peniophora sp. CONT]